MMECPNCGAQVEGLMMATDGTVCCCIHCAFNPKGCRCKWGEYGVPEGVPDVDFDNSVQGSES